MKESEVKTYLASLTDSKLVEVVYEALDKRNQGASKLLLAESYFRENSGAAHIAIAALPPKDSVINSSDRPDLINNGMCSICSAEVTAISKEAVCPICKSQVGLT